MRKAAPSSEETTEATGRYAVTTGLWGPFREDQVGRPPGGGGVGSGTAGTFLTGEFPEQVHVSILEKPLQSSKGRCCEHFTEESAETRMQSGPCLRLLGGSEPRQELNTQDELAEKAVAPVCWLFPKFVLEEILGIRGFPGGAGNPLLRIFSLTPQARNSNPDLSKRL